MRSDFPKMLRKNITTVTVIFTLVITLFVASISYYMFSSLLSNSLVQSTAFNLQLISKTIAADMAPIISLSQWCSGNSLLSRYLESATALRDAEERYIQALKLETDNSEDLLYLERVHQQAKALNRSLALSAWNRLQEEYRNNRSSLYVTRIIVSNDSKKYIQLASITSYFALSIYDTVTGLPYFDTLFGDPSLSNWVGIVNNPISDNKNEQMIPIIRPVYSLYGNKEIGWCYLSVSTYLLTNALKNYEIPESSRLFLTINEKNYEIDDGGFKPVSAMKTKNTRQTAENTILADAIDENGQRLTMVTVTSSIEGWSLSQTLSPAQFSRQRTLYIQIILLVSIIVLSLGFGLTYFLNHKINKPLSKIHHRIRLISNGDFTIDPEIEWQNELGEIGHGINMLARDVVQLMNKRIEDEKVKNDLEYQNLQSQINPHFLYNTLNSIRWMASIQNAHGIVEMTTALSRLMKNVSKDTHQAHTIREEIALLNDYFIIQKYRYGGAISLNINVEAEDLYNCEILKFTLQPMVENAIFHGIEPKGAAGRIDISIGKQDVGSILIKIRDDGIGMTEEQIESILTGDSVPASDFFKKIGISNVRRRIQYAYGASYDLSIESIPGEYTEIRILLPYKTHSRDKEASHHDQAANR